MNPKRLKLATLAIVAVVMHPAIAVENLAVLATERKPYSYIEDGEIQGSATLLIKATLDDAKIPYTLDLLPVPRAYANASNDPDTFIYPLLRTPNREDLFKWVLPLSKSITVYAYKLNERSDLVIDTLDDLREHSIGTTRNDASHQFLVSNGFTEEDSLDLAKKPSNHFKKLRSGRIDFMALSSKGFESVRKAEKIPQGEIVPAYPLFEVTAYIAASIHTEDRVIEKAQAAFETLVRTGALTKLD